MTIHVTRDIGQRLTLLLHTQPYALRWNLVDASGRVSQFGATNKASLKATKATTYIMRLIISSRGNC